MGTERLTVRNSAHILPPRLVPSRKCVMQWVDLAEWLSCDQDDRLTPWPVILMHNVGRVDLGPR